MHTKILRYEDQQIKPEKKNHQFFSFLFLICISQVSVTKTYYFCNSLSHFYSLFQKMYFKSIEKVIGTLGFLSRVTQKSNCIPIKSRLNMKSKMVGSLTQQLLLHFWLLLPTQRIVQGRCLPSHM